MRDASFGVDAEAVPPNEPAAPLLHRGEQGVCSGALRPLQRRLHGASTVGELLAIGSVEGARSCGFERGVVLSVSDDALTASGVEAIDDPACDALRRRALSSPIPLRSSSAESAVIRRAEGLRRIPSEGPSPVRDLLGLREYALAAVVPESRAVAVLVLDRATRPVGEAERSAAEIFAHVLGAALERLVLRLRMVELSRELRHLTASAHALMREALEAPVTLPADHGLGPVFIEAGPVAPPGTEIGDLLSERERKVAELMVTGRSNREIGDELHLAPDTVKAHVSRIARKLGASNRVDAAARYVRMTSQAQA